MATNGEPAVDQRLPQVSIGKVSIGKESVGADKPPAPSRFVPPDVEEVRTYCQERENGIDPVSFVDYYQARGWKYTGGQAMKDWRAAVRTWEKREKQEGGKANELPFL